jgi:hypothetical protein
VTIGIGALCNGGITAVIASDMRTTYPKSATDPNEVTGKQWDFPVPFPVVACVAGRLGLCQPVIDEISIRLSKLPFEKGVFCEHIENIIRDSRTRTFKRYVDWRVRMSYDGMTIGQWQRGKVPGGQMNQLIHDEVTKFIDGLEFYVGLIVAGFLPDGNILFYRAVGKNHIETSATPGIHVIGTGGQLAMSHLNKRDQGIHCSLPRTLLNMSEAMDKARKVPDKSVGRPQGFTVIWRDGRLARFPGQTALLRGWKKAYKNRTSTMSLDSSVVAHEQIRLLLLKHVVRQSASGELAQKK